MSYDANGATAPRAAELWTSIAGVLGLLALTLAATAPISARAQTEPEAPPAVAEPVPSEIASEPAEPAQAEPAQATGETGQGDLSLQDFLAAERHAELPGDRLPFRLRAEQLKGLPASMAALIMEGRNGGQIVVVPFAAPLVLPLGGGEGATARVPVLVEIDGPSLLGADPPPAPRVEIYAYAVTAEGGVRGFLTQGFPLDLDTLGEAVYEGGVKFVGNLALPPGDYSLRVLVYVPAAQRYGLAVRALHVPDGAALLVPFAEEPVVPWLLVADAAYDRDDAQGQPLPRIEQLLSRAGAPLPSALPVLQGEVPEVDVFLAGAAGAPEPAELQGRLSDLDGQEKAHFAAPVLRRTTTELPGLDRLRVRLPLADVAAGSYQLTLTAPAVGGRDLTSPELPVVVLHGETTARLWTDIQRRIAGDTVRPASLDLEDAKRRHGRQERVQRAVAAAYRTVLARLATSDRDGALDDLLRIESELVKSGTELPFEVLDTAEGQVLEELAMLEPEAVLPVVSFASDAYARYRDAHDYGLASHSRRIAERAAEVYAGKAAEATGDSVRRRLASEALASLGAELQASFVMVAGRELLERALQLDPQSRFALLNLAAAHEKTAEYAPAVELLRRIVALDPKSPEGRLRLGINLIRLDQTADGLAILQRLVHEDNPPWILSLAYETIASYDLGKGRAGDAAALLGQAAGRLPEEGRLAIQRAYALERAGRGHEAAQAIERLAPSREGPSPRNRYTRWPDDERQRIGDELAQASLVRLPALGATLERLPATTGGGA